jgi:hypothetical protein
MLLKPMTFLNCFDNVFLLLALFVPQVQCMEFTHRDFTVNPCGCVAALVLMLADLGLAAKFGEQVDFFDPPHEKTS